MAVGSMAPEKVDVSKVNVLTDRVLKLKQAVQEARPSISSQTTHSFTESWKETERQPIDLRRAKAYARILKDSPVVIRDGELIVGSQTKNIRAAAPVTAIDPKRFLMQLEERRLEHIKSSASFAEIDEEEESVLREDTLFWDNYLPREDFLTEELRRELGDDYLDMLYNGARIYGNPEPIRGQRLGQGAGIAMNLRILRDGLNSVIARARAEQEKINHSSYQLSHVSPAGYHKHILLRSIIITCEALIDFARRHADLARKLASEETDPVRKKELEAIAEHCDWVPANPPRGFAEALQSFQFLHLGLRKDPYDVIALGRLDYYLYPYYEKELKEGRITRQEAAELLGCLYVKINESDAFPLAVGEVTIRGSLLPHITIGGRTREGKDVTNDLSYLILEVTRQMKFPEPAVYIRYHDGISHDFMIKALETNREIGGGNPAYLNDQLGTARLLAKGCDLDDAIDWSAEGCLGQHVPHIFMGAGADGLVGHLNLPKIFELTLYNGFDPRMGKQLGLPTGDVTGFTSIEQIREAWEKQVDRFLDLTLEAHFISHSIKRTEEGSPPLTSVMIEDCIEKGLGPHEGGGARYPGITNYSVAERGCTDVADSLAAIKKLVFDEKKMTIAELIEALRTDWEGKEDIRQACLKAPKYGNDDDYVDDIFNYISLKVQQMILGKRDPFTGLPPNLLRPAASSHVPHGEVVGALPNGRKAGTPINDAALSPMAGVDVNGPTAVINSATKVNHAWEEAGIVLNMKFSRPLLGSPENLEKVLSLIKTFFDRGGWHVQFNIVSADDLINARKHPEKWKNLIVRVAGFSAYFVDLPLAIQDEIIARTLHTV